MFEADSNRGRALFPDRFALVRKPKTARSLLWFAAIKYLECVKDSAGLTPKGRLVAAETIEREIRQVG